jgi:multicomponent Na+:H+ antiporter subunit F
MWTLTAIAMLVCLLGPFIRCVRGDAVSRLVALEAASSMTVVMLLLLSEAYHRVPFVDLALALALLSFGGGLVFARFLERWL